MKKQGFTLAEIIITLAIIGILAALVTPALLQSSRDKANAAKLSSTISNIEKAFQTAILSERANSLYDTQLWSEAPINATTGNRKQFVEALDNYLNTNGFQDSFSNFYGSTAVYSISDNGSKGSKIDNFPYISDTFAIRMKNGAVLFLSTFDNKDSVFEQKKLAKSEDCSLYTNAADVAIDINGIDAPNIIGKDIFFFNLGEDGALYPFGGKDVARITDGGEWNSADATFACTDNTKGAANAKGLGCTARIIAEGYKVNY